MTTWCCFYRKGQINNTGTQLAVFHCKALKNWTEMIENDKKTRYSVIKNEKSVIYARDETKSKLFKPCNKYQQCCA